MRKTVRCLVAAMLIACAASPAMAIVQEGQPAPNFTKSQLDYPVFGQHTPRSLTEFSGKVVVLFVMGWS